MNGVQGKKTCESKLSFLNYPYRYSKKKFMEQRCEFILPSVSMNSTK